MHLKTDLLLNTLILLVTSLFITQCADEPAPQPNIIGTEQYAQVHQLLEKHVEDSSIAGASALVLQDGEVAYKDHVGWLDAASKTPMSDETIFRIASMTKAITSAAVMILQEEGRLSLEDPVSKYIPEFSDPQVVVGWDSSDTSNIQPETVPAKHEITIHDLMTHTSGLSYSFMSGNNYAALLEEANVTDGLVQTDATTAQNINNLASVPLMFQPGTQWHYSLAHDVLGRVIEVASGQSLDGFFREQIFEPLHMDDTHFFLPEEKLDRMATLYTVDSEKKITPTGDDTIQAGNLTYSADFHYEGPETYYSGGGGLVSTLGDYGRFLQMLLGGGTLDGNRVLEQASVQAMTQNQIGSLQVSPFTSHGDKFGYGFGVLTDQGKADDVASVGTYSWGGIFNTYYWVDPKEEIVGIIMTQLFPYDHLTLRNDFKETVYKDIKN